MTSRRAAPRRRATPAMTVAVVATLVAALCVDAFMPRAQGTLSVFDRMGAVLPLEPQASRLARSGVTSSTRKE